MSSSSSAPPSAPPPAKKARTEPHCGARTKAGENKARKVPHGGARIGAGGKSNNSKLTKAGKDQDGNEVPAMQDGPAVVPIGNFFKPAAAAAAAVVAADTTTTAAPTAASGSSSDYDSEGWSKHGGFDDERVSDDEQDGVDESAPSAASGAR